MLKQIAMLEIIKGENVYQLHLPNNCNLGEVHDVLFQMRTYVMEKIADVLKADAPKVDNSATKVDNSTEECKKCEE